MKDYYKNETTTLTPRRAAVISVDNSRPTGSKEFRITYRMEVYVKADSEDEAKAKFENMDDDKLNRDARFVEMVSCEDASTL